MQVKIVQEMPGLRTILVLQSVRLTTRIRDSMLQLPKGMRGSSRKA